MEGKFVGELNTLAEHVRAAQEAGKKVVLCHGVFDLLHVGHIKHFESAKQLGDILVVTVTPDRFVNKGPGRPVFAEHLRLEAVAALGCVDYVALNLWPTAIETIRLLRPDIYAKGPDYRDRGSDVTGKIVEEEEAIASVGGHIAITDDETYSSSTLINEHFSTLTAEAKTYLAAFTRHYRVDELQDVVRRAADLNVLVIGEAIIDEYQYCTAIGKSSKEPTLVVKRLSEERFAGGILAVANHVAEFTESVSALSVLGEQNSQEDFVRESLNGRVTPHFIMRQDAPTIVKRRLIDRYFFTKMMEVYEINDFELGKDDNEQLCSKLEQLLPRHDLVVVVDYGHGFLSKEAIDIICSNSRFLAVNAQSNAGNLGYHTISMYPRADYVTMTEGELRLEARNRRGALDGIVEDVARRLSCPRVAVTRGKHGSLCYDKDAGFFEIPAFAGKVVDRVGAGDAFFSVSALCAAQQVPMEIVGFMGNAAGAQAVAVVGNKDPVRRDALMKQIETLFK